MLSPTVTVTPRVLAIPTREAQLIATRETLRATSTLSPLPQVTELNNEPTLLLPTLDPLLLTQLEDVPPESIVIGYSVEGREIAAVRFGGGERVLLLIGGMHGGWEANTVDLVETLTEHFRLHPEAVLPGMSVVLIAAANPDGLLRGRTQEGRFNAQGVDLNRNWGCDWSPEAVWRNQAVNPGATAFSEPESRALAEYIRGLNPAAVVFYHSAANGVYAGDCDTDSVTDSHALEAVLGEAAGYGYGQPFDAYVVTGTAPNWVDGIGIPSVDVELRTSTDTEFEQNLRGVMAVQRWLIEGQ